MRLWRWLIAVRAGAPAARLCRSYDHDRIPPAEHGAAALVAIAASALLDGFSGRFGGYGYGYGHGGVGVPGIILL
jgi:hypothetical protein